MTSEGTASKENIDLDSNSTGAAAGADAAPPEFVTGEVKSGIDILRKRLLDLSKRNRLLNFRFTKRSTLRVIDELPDQLYSNLVAGRSFYLDPVPLPQSAQEKMSFWEANPDLLESGQSSEDWKNERDIPRPPVAKFAKYLGIETSFDLPVAAEGEAEEKHQDKLIQTLQYPDDLEASAARIASLSRTAIEETGSNMLFLSFGFLEWSESDDSDRKYLAPLFLLPVSLERQKGSRNGQFSYELNYTGEDLEVNLSLREKLKIDFGLALPELDEDDTPETYWLRFKQLLKDKPTWSIRRQVALSMLQFGKQLIYLDLDPDKWPQNKSLLKHNLLKSIFEGGDSAEVGYAEEYEIDELDDGLANLPTVTDADSSQHSALVDAVKGKNLVIEGPPGTGKSQTITNLIGCALAEGKRVLFVSEKLAALQVVRRNLNVAGLGDFTLELHSNKTQKQGVLADIGNRVKKIGSFSNPRELQNAISELDSKKQELKQYVEYLNHLEESLGQSRFNLLHKTVLNERRLLDANVDLTKLKGDNFGEDPETDFSQRQEALSVLERSIKSIIEDFNSLRGIPWFGINLPELRPRDKDKIIEKFKFALDKADALEMQLDSLECAAGIELSRAHLVIGTLATLKSELTNLGDPKIWPALPFVRKDGAKEKLKQLVDLLTEHAERAEKFNVLISSSISDTAAIEGARPLAIDLNEKLASDVEFSSISGLLDQLASIEEQMGNLEPILRGISRLMQFSTDNLTPDGVGRCADVLRLASLAPNQYLSGREDLFRDEIDDELRELTNLYVDLRARKSEIDEVFQNWAALSIDQLKEWKRILESSGLFRFVSPHWLRVVADVRSLRRKGQSLQGVDRLGWVNKIIAFIEGLTEFEGQKYFQELLGEKFKGLETDTDELNALRQWYSEVQDTFGRGFDEAALLGAKLIEADIETIKGVQRLEKMGGLDALMNLSESLLQLNSKVVLGKFSSNPVKESVQSIRASLQSLQEQRERISIEILHDDFTGAHLLEAVDSGLRCCEISNQVSFDEFYPETLGEHFRGVETDLSGLNGLLDFCNRLEGSKIIEPIQNYIFRMNDPEAFRALEIWADEAQPLADSYLSEAKALQQSLLLDQAHWYDGVGLSGDLSIFRERAANALNAEGSLGQWVGYIQNKVRANEVGLGPIINLVEMDAIVPEQMHVAHEYATFFPAADGMMQAGEYLGGMNGDLLTEMREQFRSLDQKIQMLNRELIASKLDANMPPAGRNAARVSDKTEMSLIHHLLGLQRPRTSIRRLIRQSSEALQSLKPCWMMGPLSVAQYLTPGKVEFDLIIMDEASQLKPEDAIGSIARGKQVVVVGDSKQLPPTDFFNANVDNEEEEEDENAVAEAESILDAASGIFRPSRRLRWHYRSQCEELIAFSNRKFYNDDLVVFPSPNAKRDGMGIEFEFIPNASCRKGKNIVEAKRVAQEAINFMRSGTSRSLGIVAMNSVQRTLIEEEFYKLLRGDLEAEAYLEARARGSERFFVKNLENVQGDERDVIFISFTYGPDPESGKVLNRFGPINTEHGWRRLNVLFTRAKKKVVAFSSMRSEDVKLTPNSKLGPAALKGYLEFADTGTISGPELTGRLPDSPFEEAVAEALEQRGYKCVAQLGVAGYFLDIAVRHPDMEDGYILAVECDGATYHSAKSVRDRDRLRQLVLERLGWNVHRIWSTDWFEDSEGQIQKVCDKIEVLRGAYKSKIAREDERASKKLRVIEPLEEIQDDLEQKVESEDLSKSDDEVKKPRSIVFISLEEAREQLIDLRENQINIEMPNADKTKGLLRDEMIEEFLHYLPTEQDEFLRDIPLKMRSQTAPDQLKGYLGKVFDILINVE